MVLVTRVKFLGGKLEVTIPLLRAVLQCPIILSDQPYETPTSQIYFTVQTSAACCVHECVLDCVVTYIHVHRTPSYRV